MFGTRYYDPSVGRWTQQDAAAGSIGDPSSVNRYAYVGGDPVNFADPDGLKRKGLLDKLKCVGGEVAPNPFSASEGSLVEAGGAVAVAGIKGGGAAVAIGGSAAAATALAAPIVAIGIGAMGYGAYKIGKKCF